jgi:hypothetical protein
VVLETLRVWLRQRQLGVPQQQNAATTLVDRHLQAEVEGPEADTADTHHQKAPRQNAMAPRPNLEILHWCNESPGPWVRHVSVDKGHNNVAANARTKSMIRYL